MTQEEKGILLKDLCGRLPYGVKVQYKGNRYDLTKMHKDGRTYLGSYNSIYGDWHCSLEFEDYLKPYLRPMSSMTEEELAEFVRFSDHIRESECKIHIANYNQLEWLNKNMFDYRGLIPLGLAIEVTKDNNPYKE